MHDRNYEGGVYNIFFAVLIYCTITFSTNIKLKNYFKLHQLEILLKVALNTIKPTQTPLVLKKHYRLEVVVFVFVVLTRSIATSVLTNVHLATGTHKVECLFIR